MSRIILFTALFFFIVSCQNSEIKTPSKETLFKKIHSEQSGISFTNLVKDNPEYNYLTYEGFYQGAGVGLGDFNNDGLLDIFFAGNQSSDKLFINKGDFLFEDITVSSGIIEDDSWSTGVAIVDINNDGLEDIYVSKFFYEDTEKRKNLLYINTGNNTFKEAAKEFGLDDSGYTIQANFFDYDKDGDLDVYIVNQPPTKNSIRYNIGSKIDYRYSDRLYQNNGEYGFKNVTKASGLQNFGYGLNVLASDLTNDGWLDLYVSNDFEEADFFYENNQDGTFSLKTKEALGHISTYSMGSDAADVNNDGFVDFLVADMIAVDPYRQKTNMSSMNVGKFNRLTKIYGLPQYMYNAFQINDGFGKFSEQGQVRGLAYSDWSWSVLMADFDNDMDKDILITNGIQNDVTNKDILNNMASIKEEYNKSRKSYEKKGILSANELVLNQMPSSKLQNHFYSNDGSGFFERSNEQFGLEESTWTHGAAYGDLDNDGDLDLVLNHSSESAGIYQNQSTNNYIRINLTQDEFKKCPIGAKVWAYTNNIKQVVELSPIRGYQSTSECTAHFGLKSVDLVDSIIVVWPDLTKRKLGKLPVNKTYNIQKSRSKLKFDSSPKSELLSIADSILLENDQVDDYSIQRLLPYEISTLGPKVDYSSVNKHIFIPGAKNSASKVYGFENDNFSKLPLQVFEEHAAALDVAGHFVDVDNDGDDDLIVVTGGFNPDSEQSEYYDRLYMKEGDEYLYYNEFPKIPQSGLAISSFDIDNNGFKDIIIGGRVEPGKYGFPPPTYLYLNNGNLNFEVKKNKHNLGMVTDLQFSDLNQDNSVELVTSTEWGAIRIFEFIDGEFQEKTKSMGVNSENGLWRSVYIDDFNNDGYKDIFCGNLGLNSKFIANEDRQLYLSYGDFDANGTYDLYLTYDFEGKEIPVRGRQCSAEQLPEVKEKWSNYNSFALLTADDIIGEVDSNHKLSCTTLNSSIFLGSEHGFTPLKLPDDFQVSCINDMIKMDPNEWIVIGNYFEMEAETPRLDQLNVISLSFQDEKYVSKHYSSNNKLKNSRSILNAENSIVISTNSGVYILEKHIDK